MCLTDLFFSFGLIVYHTRIYICRQACSQLKTCSGNKVTSVYKRLIRLATKYRSGAGVKQSLLRLPQLYIFSYLLSYPLGYIELQL